MAKIYELTTNGLDGYIKYYVVGISNDSEARELAKRVFGKYYWDSGISLYDTTEYAKSMKRKKYWMTKQKFLELKKEFIN